MPYPVLLSKAGLHSHGDCLCVSHCVPLCVLGGGPQRWFVLGVVWGRGESWDVPGSLPACPWWKDAEG